MRKKGIKIRTINSYLEGEITEKELYKASLAMTRIMTSLKAYGEKELQGNI